MHRRSRVAHQGLLDPRLVSVDVVDPLVDLLASLPLAALLALVDPQASADPQASRAAVALQVSADGRQRTSRTETIFFQQIASLLRCTIHDEGGFANSPRRMCTNWIREVAQMRATARCSTV